MIIERLEAKHFGIIGDEIDVTFPEEERIGIFGRNETGKSTILQAIETSLFGMKRGRSATLKRDNLVTWGKDEASIALEFRSAGNRYRIEREIGAENGHEARLYALMDGSRELLEDNVTSVDDRIQQITGMDRNSFTKLVCIKQKQLDALKELGKSDREKLVNSVMGMDEFDAADDNLMEDRRALKKEIEQLEQNVKHLKEKKETYEEAQDSEEELSKAIEQIKEDLEEQEETLEAKKEDFERLEWLHDKEEKETLLDEKKDNLESAEKEQERLSGLTDTVEELKKEEKTLTDLEDEHEDTFEELQTLHEEVTSVNEDIDELTDTLEEKNTELAETAAEAGIDGDELELADNIPEQKSTALKQAAGFAIIAVVAVVAGLMVHPLLFAGLVSLYPAYRQYNEFSRLDELTTYHTDITSLNSQIQETKDNLADKKEKRDDLLGEDYENVGNVQSDINDITETLQDEADVENFDGLKEKRKGIQTQIEKKEKEIKELEKEDINDRIEKLNSEMEKLDEQLEELGDEPPENVESVTYTEDAYETAKEEKETAEKELNELKESLKEKQGELKQVKKTVEELDGVDEEFEETEQELEDAEYKKQVLERARAELQHTSQSLREEVLPHAEIVINNLLPTLTESRYARLNIDEDLSFNVHSVDAGEEKERDVFSGGTQDQFLIALRLAFTQSILDSRVRADRYALMMDECTSSSDDQRKQGVFQVLDGMSNVFSQIFIIAHEDISNDVDEHIILERDDNGYTQIQNKSW